MAPPAKIVTMSITTSNSRRVNPPRALCRWGSLPVGDVIRRTLDPVRASREEVIVFAVVLPGGPVDVGFPPRIKRRSEEHTSELQSQSNLVCRLLLEKKKKKYPLTSRTRSTRYVTTHQP